MKPNKLKYFIFILKLAFNKKRKDALIRFFKNVQITNHHYLFLKKLIPSDNFAKNCINQNILIFLSKL